MVVTNRKHVGVDIGSTTVKVVVLDDTYNILFRRYERHHSKVREMALEILAETAPLLQDGPITVSLSGSAALSVAELTGIDFVQEVFATKTAVDTMLDRIDVVVELGGEDAKILFLTGGNEEWLPFCPCPSPSWTISVIITPIFITSLPAVVFLQNPISNLCSIRVPINPI